MFLVTFLLPLIYVCWDCSPHIPYNTKFKTNKNHGCQNVHNHEITIMAPIIVSITPHYSILAQFNFREFSHSKMCTGFNIS